MGSKQKASSFLHSRDHTPGELAPFLEQAGPPPSKRCCARDPEGFPSVKGPSVPGWRLLPAVQTYLAQPGVWNALSGDLGLESYKTVPGSLRVTGVPEVLPSMQDRHGF